MGNELEHGGACAVPVLLMTSGGGSDQSRDRVAVSHSPGRIGAGRRRHPRRTHCPAKRARSRCCHSIWAGPPPRSVCSRTGKDVPPEPLRSIGRRDSLRAAGYRCRIPVIEMVEIGAGGGSMRQAERAQANCRGAGELGFGSRSGLLRARRWKDSDGYRRRPRPRSHRSPTTSPAAALRLQTPKLPSAALVDDRLANTARPCRVRWRHTGSPRWSMRPWPMQPGSTR